MKDIVHGFRIGFQPNFMELNFSKIRFGITYFTSKNSGKVTARVALTGFSRARPRSVRTSNKILEKNLIPTTRPGKFRNPTPNPDFSDKSTSIKLCNNP